MSGKARPIRTCTGCGLKKDKAELLRLVAGPDGSIVPDLRGNLPSRGAHICPDAVCIKKASAGRLAHSLKVSREQPMTFEELQKAVADVYERRVLSLLGQARKSGQITSGTSLVEGDLRKGTSEALLGIVASDASQSVREKILASFGKAGVPYRVFVGKGALGCAIGKSERSVILVKDAGIARALMVSVDHYDKVRHKGGSDQ